MEIIKPSVVLERDFDGAEVMKFIESCGRTCYKSQSTATSADTFIRNLIRRGHESVLEHFSATFRIICDRGVMAELTRHRHCSFSVESTRYCDYSKRGLKFIKPDGINPDTWEYAMIRIEDSYDLARISGAPPEIARSVLPLSLATELVMTANLREWRHILKLRTSTKAHPQMRQIAGMILDIFKIKLPVIVEDIKNDTAG